MPFGGFAGAIGGALLGGVGSIISGNRASSSNARRAALDRAFQKEVYQNQLQWKAADAKKAGLHPLSVIGTGSYSPSPSSVPSSGYPGLSDSLGKLGEGFGDAFTAYMNKDQIEAAKAQSDLQFNKQMELLDAQIGEIRARTAESVKRTSSYSVPFATGREVVPGQVDAPVVDKLPGYKKTTGLVSDKNSAFHVWHMGNGAYDINFNPDYQQTVGDEIGQLVNALKAATRSDVWVDPDTGHTYYYDSDSGYYYRSPRIGHRDWNGGGGGA